MKPIRVAAIIFVIMAGLVGSYLIIRNQGEAVISNQTEKNQDLSANAGNLSITQNPIQWLGNAVKSVADSVQGLSDLDKFLAENGGTSKTEEKDSVNLTKLVAESLFSQMQKSDQNEKNPFDPQSFDPNSLEGQKLIQEAVASVHDPAAFFGSSVDDKDLKISNDNSKEVKIQYLRGLEQISNNRLMSNPEYSRGFEQVAKDIQVDCTAGGLSIHKELAQLQRDLLKDYLSLTVPRDWLSLHREAVNYYEKANLIYSALGNCFQDPIKGSLAAQAWPQLFEEKQKIQNALNAKWMEEIGF